MLEENSRPIFNNSTTKITTNANQNFRSKLFNGSTVTSTARTTDKNKTNYSGSSKRTILNQTRPESTKRQLFPIASFPEPAKRGKYNKTNMSTVKTKRAFTSGAPAQANRDEKYDLPDATTGPGTVHITIDEIHAIIMKDLHKQQQTEKQQHQREMKRHEQEKKQQKVEMSKLSTQIQALQQQVERLEKTQTKITSLKPVENPPHDNTPWQPPEDGKIRSHRHATATLSRNRFDTLYITEDNDDDTNTKNRRPKLKIRNDLLEYQRRHLTTHTVPTTDTRNKHIPTGTITTTHIMDIEKKEKNKMTNNDGERGAKKQAAMNRKAKYRKQTDERVPTLYTNRFQHRDTKHKQNEPIQHGTTTIELQIHKEYYPKSTESTTKSRRHADLRITVGGVKDNNRNSEYNRSETNDKIQDDVRHRVYNRTKANDKMENTSTTTKTPHLKNKQKGTIANTNTHKQSGQQLILNEINSQSPGVHIITNLHNTTMSTSTDASTPSDEYHYYSPTKRKTSIDNLYENTTLQGEVALTKDNEMTTGGADATNIANAIFTLSRPDTLHRAHTNKIHFELQRRVTLLLNRKSQLKRATTTDEKDRAKKSIDQQGQQRLSSALKPRHNNSSRLSPGLRPQQENIRSTNGPDSMTITQQCNIESELYQTQRERYEEL